jgi:uncharacterized protein
LTRSYVPYQQANNNKLLYIYILLYICIVNTNCLLSQDSNYVRLYDDSEVLTSEGLLINNLPHGEWISYHPNGKIKSKGSWKDNNLIGAWLFYNYNGILTKKEEYQKNLKFGLSTSYDSLGRLIKQTNYKENKKNGIELIMFKNQKQIKFKYNYLNNLKHNLNKEYDSTGNIISLIKYDMGVVISKEEINRVDRDLKKHGVWKTFYKNENIKSQQTYFHGNLNGASKTYNSKGGIKSIENHTKDGIKASIKKDIKISKTKNREGFTIKGVIKKNIKNGLFKVYDENNKLFKQEFYNNDTLVFSGLVDTLNNKNGIWLYYYSNGNIKKKGTFKNNRKTGVWEFFYENKNLEQKGNYLNGIPQGKWIWWYENKQERRKEEYVRGKISGIVYEYDSIGTIITEGNYINGIKDGEWIYIYNDFKESGFFADGMRTGEWKALYKNGNKLFTGEYLNDIPINIHTYYFPNGKVKEKGAYLRGEKDGEWKKYNYQGVVVITTEYRNGEEYKVDGVKLRNK